MNRYNIGGKEIFVACACGGLKDHEFSDGKGGFTLNCKCGCHTSPKNAKDMYFHDTTGKWEKYSQNVI